MNKKVKTTCPYCGVGCGVLIEKKEGGKFSVSGDESHPANFGKLCTKGRALVETLGEESRIESPIVHGERASWESALETVAKKFDHLINEYGPNSIAFYVSGQLLTEDYYVANKLMKGFIGTANIDTNSRLCMSSPVIAQQKAFGSDTVPVNYTDLEKADLIVLVGSNLAWCHPVLFQRIKSEKAKRRDLKVIVIDPRLTASVEVADQILRIRSGTDLLLFNTLFNYLEENGLSDLKETPNNLKETVATIRHESKSLLEVSEQLGIELNELLLFLNSFSETEKIVTIYSQGVNQSTKGVDTCSAIINCHLLTNRIGREGMGPFSITGQPNAMGGREVGAMATTLAAHLSFSPDERELLRKFWQSNRIATEPGLKAVDLFEAIETGEIKAVWIMATNPIVSLPDNDKVRSALEKCEMVVLNEAFNSSETVELADVVFPAQPWGEKNGTVTNSERRISRQRSFKEPFGQAMPDWKIICGVANAMGFKSGFNFKNEFEVFKEHAALSEKAFKFTGSFNLTPLKNITLAQYNNLPPFQWPQTDTSSISLSEVRPFCEQAASARSEQKPQLRFHTANGRPNLIPVRFFDSNASKQSKSGEQVKVSTEPMWRLNTGRIRDQWHTMTRTSLARRLNQHTLEPLLHINPLDAQEIGVADKSLAIISGNENEALVRVNYTNHVNRRELFFPMHWGKSWSESGTINRLIGSIRDPQSGQPAFKQGNVQLSPSNIKTQALIASRVKLEFPEMPYMVCSLIEGGYLYLLAGYESRLSFKPKIKQILNEKFRANFSAKELVTLKLLSGGNESSDYETRSYFLNNEVIASVQISNSFDNLSTNWLSEIFNPSSKGGLEASLISGRSYGNLSEGKKICLCSGVGVKQFDSVRSEQFGDCKEEIGQNLNLACQSIGAGGGCGSCVGDLYLKLTETCQN